MKLHFFAFETSMYIFRVQRFIAIASCTFLTNVTSWTEAVAQTQTCPVEPYDLLMPAGLATGDEYGYVMVTSGEWLFVGAPMDDQIGTDAGAVYVFQVDGGMYEFRQKLLATGGFGAGHFGFSLAAERNVLIVGAENDQEITKENSSAWGAAYVFRLNESAAWVQEQKLFAFGSDAARRHGFSVAVKGGVAIVSARLLTSKGVDNPGAAFIYRFDGTSWLSEQRVMADVPTPVDHFGLALDASESRIVVGSRQNDDQMLDAGAVFVFEHDGATWVQTSKFYAPDPTSGAWFGHAVTTQGDTIVVGAPNAVTPTSATGGAAYVFNWNGSNWAWQQKMVGRNDDGCGSSLALSNDTLLIGAPDRNTLYVSAISSQGGGTDLYHLINGEWAYERTIRLSQPENDYGSTLYRCWLNGPPPMFWPEKLPLWPARFGVAVAISPLGFLSSSALVREQCWGFAGPFDSGAVNHFATNHEFADCNSNGIPDQSDLVPDCNGDNIPNECDFLDGIIGDCNINALPDECDARFRYQLSSNFGWYAWSPSPSTGNADFIWLNQFRVKPGGQIITHIALERSGFIPMGSPVSVMLYSDPTNDGDPIDAELLTVVETSTVSYETCDTPTNWRTIVPIEATHIGPPGTFFFVGAVVRPTVVPSNGHYWAAAISVGASAGQVRRSWYAMAPPGQGDIEDLANNAVSIRLFLGGPWTLRAIAADCNLNGVWDQCDIDSGFSLDINGDGIPDECETTTCLFADISSHGLGDGQVDLSDLLYVINYWGVCNPCHAICIGDANDDCAVNALDLLTVINNWGTCPR